MNDEITVFEDSSATITSRRIVVGGTTYALRNITSVKMGTTEPSGCGSGCLMFFGGLGVCGAIYDLISKGAWMGMSVFLVFLAAAVGGVMWQRTLKTSYSLILVSSSGETHALSSPDKDYVEKVVAHISDAIVRHQ